MSARVERCDRCKRGYRKQYSWNGVFREGLLVGLLCGQCQPPEENVQGEISSATLAYSTDSHGHAVGRAQWVDL